MKLGFIGMGNMAYAILKGGVDSGFLKQDAVYAYDPNADRQQRIAAQTGMQPLPNSTEVAKQSDIIMLAVKPDVIPTVVEELYPQLENKGVICIAAGWTTDRISEILPKSSRVLYVMPNTPCMVGGGMALGEDTATLNDAERAFALGLFNSMGRIELVTPKIMDGASTLTGCGPAFVYVMIEALADGGVFHGVPRRMAYDLIAQTFIGAGKMVLETQQHPGELKDNVCSPGGTTIKGVRAMEDGALRSILINAVDAATGCH